MKKFQFLSLAILMTMMASAKPVDSDRAAQVAKNFVAQYVKGTDQYTATVVYTHPMPKNGQPAMYAVNVGSMFVIVAADDVAHPVLGYSLSRPWPTQIEKGKLKNANAADASINPPSQVTSYLDDLASQIEFAIGRQGDPDRETAAEWQQLLTLNTHLLTTNPPDSVGPLLSTTWDQGQYYNAICPEDTNGPDGHVYTGCVATAMAQTINYWGYPIHGRGTHSYQSDYGTLTVNYDSANYDYVNMPTTLTATSTPAQVNAVAKLMYDCGVAANMSYGPTESNSYDVDARAGLINFFRFSPDLSLAEKAYFSNDEWDNLIRTDIATGRPVLYSGRGIGGGHAFVCDGYKHNGFYHFNFGWSGNADGWYLTNAVTPGNYTFNGNQTALFGIAPDSTSNIILPSLSGINFFTLEEPMYFLDFLGNNRFVGPDHSNIDIRPTSVTQFYLPNNSDSIVVDILEHEGQSVLFHDGISNQQLDIWNIWSDTTLHDTLRFIYHAFVENNISPVVSSTNAISLSYYGYYSYTGFKMKVSKASGCRIPSGLHCTLENGQMNVSWLENGNSQAWQVEYGTKGYQEGEGSIIYCDSMGAILQGLNNMQVYELRVRAACNENEYSDWTGKILAKTGTYWQDIVTEEPAGFSVNDQGEISVATPEALVWICKLKHEGYYSYFTVKQTADIDLAGHWWRPGHFFGIYDGQNYTISNLTIYEPQKQSGFGTALLGNLSDGMVKNLTLASPNVLGQHAGGIAGSASRSSILNCRIKQGDIHGYIAGSIVGALDDSYITNCYATGLVSYRTDLGTGGIIGGFCGNVASYSITNCYTSCNVDYGYASLEEKGSFAGYAEWSSNLSHCYYYPTENLAAVGENASHDSFYINVSAMTSQENLQILNINSIINNVSYTDLLSALNAWVDANDTASIYRHWAADLTGENGGFPVFEPICTPIMSIDSIVECDNYTWHGTTYTASVEMVDTLTAINGCDSVVTLNLTINYSTTTTVTDTAENSYTWNGTTYTESGTYQWQGVTTEGCDSTVTLILVINHAGIGEIENSKMDIDIYPNPTTGQLTIDAEDILSVEVFDPSGRKVATHKCTNKIDLAKLPASTYIFKIHLPSGTSLQRVILK